MAPGFRSLVRAALVLGLVAAGCVPRTTRTVPEPPSPTNPLGAAQWRRLALVDEHGRVPAGARMAAIEARHANLDAWGAFEDAGIAPASWVSRGPQNVGGRTRALAIHPTNPDVAWAGAVSGGVWKTVDGGTSWVPLDDFMPNLAANALALDPTQPDVLYAGTGEGYFNGDAVLGAGIFKSVDGGATWQQLPATAAWLTVNRIALSPSDPDVVLAAVRWGGIWRSTDAGATWTNVLPAQGSFDVDFDPNVPGNAVAHVLDTDGSWYHQVAYSTDDGVTWQVASGLDRVDGLYSRIELAWAPSAPGMVYANNAGDGAIWRSLDGGASFAQLSPAGVTGATWYYNALWVSPTDRKLLVVGEIDLWRSTDGGLTFQRISDGGLLTTEPHPDHHAIVEDPGFDGTTNKRVWIGTDGGVFRTDDITTASTSGGWVQLNDTYQTAQYYEAAGHGGTGRLLGGTQDNGTLAAAPAATDATLMFGGDGGFVAIDPTDDRYCYGEHVRLQIHRSTDFCQSASYIYAGITDAGTSQANFVAPFVLDPNDPRRMLAGGRSLWRSDDVRTAPVPVWQSIRPAGGSNISAIAVAPGDSEVIWVAQNDGRIERTANGLAPVPAWIPVDDNGALDPLPDRFPTRIVIAADDPATVYVSFGGFSAGNVWRTDDAGQTWSDASGSIPTALPPAPVRGLARHPCAVDWLYAGTEVGVFASEDRGQSWSASNDGPANVSVDSLAFLSGSTTLLAGTHGRGLWTAETGPGPDFDGDGVGDGCDLDDDGDGVADVDDCAPLDPTATAPVVEVSGLVLARAATTDLAWSGQGAASYHVSGGVAADLAVDGGVRGAQCLAADLAATAWTDPRPDPPPGHADYFLVRASNACGAGSWGQDSSGAERAPAAACP